MKIAVVGLGYVGMPLAVALSKYQSVIGYDINKDRIKELNDEWDRNREIRQEVLRSSTCVFTDDIKDIASADLYIVTVPTPIDENNDPDLTIVRNASKAIGQVLHSGNIVVYESTVYPGVTEDVCGRILEEESGLISGKDFFLGYSPERINPGDQEHTVENITKVVAAQNEEIAEILFKLYGQMNNGNIYKASNIKTAEASKAIENAQRDINIAFMNEVAIILNKMGLSVNDVIDAASTKWNFLPFKPGLVGGHCIGVDPYYLAKAAMDVNHTPKVILSGRSTNNSMGEFIAEEIVRHLSLARDEDVKSLEQEEISLLMLGFTFKENINDFRNTKVIDVYNELKKFNINVDIHDPYAYPEEVDQEYGIKIRSSLPKDKKYDSIALAVNHDIYADMTNISICSLLKDQRQALIYDIKSCWKGLNFPSSILYKTL